MKPQITQIITDKRKILNPPHPNPLPRGERKKERVEQLTHPIGFIRIKV